MTSPFPPDRPNPPDLVPFDQARAAVLERLRPLPAREVPLGDALGCILAEDVTAAEDLPPFANSAMDGFAVHAADLTGASDAAPVALQVTGEVFAGTARLPTVQSGGAARIMTGGPLPPGADAVVPVEQTTPLDAAGAAGSRGRDAAGALPAAVLVHAAVAPGAHVRRRGSDLADGATILASGTGISPAAVALAAGAGLASLHVRRRPRVAVLATGNEVRPAGTELGPAGIPDANGPGLRALVIAAGADPIDLGIAPDDLDTVIARLRTALGDGADAIVVAGGVSVGPYDVVKLAFETVGRIQLWRVAVQPGKPFAFGTARRSDGGHALLFGLPGNPVSSFVTFELFVRPAIRALAGRRDLLRPVDHSVLLDEVRTAAGRRAFLRVTAERDSDGAPFRDQLGRVRVRLAHGPAGQGSHVLSALAGADALAVVREEVETHAAGDPVDLWWLDAP
jgi:molybdopterin molybdotransferase